MRKDYEMTQADLNDLLSAMTPQPMIMLQCGAPRSTQERANDAWAELGKRMHFDPMTVRPNGKGDRFFSADALPENTKPKIFKDGNSWCATHSDFVNLQVSKAGFGETPKAAFLDLMGQS